MLIVTCTCQKSSLISGKSDFFQILNKEIILMFYCYSLYDYLEPLGILYVELLATDISMKNKMLFSLCLKEVSSSYLPRISLTQGNKLSGQFNHLCEKKELKT